MENILDDMPPMYLVVNVRSKMRLGRADFAETVGGIYGSKARAFDAMCEARKNDPSLVLEIQEC